MKSLRVGILQSFHVGDHARVEEVLSDLRAYGVQTLRTGVSWAEWAAPEGEEWFGWLLPRLARELDVLPCFTYTPSHPGMLPSPPNPPRVLEDYPDFLDLMGSRFGDCFEWVELMNGRTHPTLWNRRSEGEGPQLAEMVGGAAQRMRQCGKRVCLGGMDPFDPDWLHLMGECGVLAHVDAVGLQGFPGRGQRDRGGWELDVERAREVLRSHGAEAELWITGTGYSSIRYDERHQVEAFVAAAAAPVSRLYWYAAQDLERSELSSGGGCGDEGAPCFGLKRPDGTRRLLGRLWAEGGIEAVREFEPLARPRVHVAGRDAPVLITGGSGFIGTNLARSFLDQGRPVIVYDNLSRPGVEGNLHHLLDGYDNLVRVRVEDVRNPVALSQAVREAGLVYHLAAQVAVTTSLLDPETDFDINARGTLNVLEAVRALPDLIPVVFTSTNKVYGGLEDLAVIAGETRYSPADQGFAARGVPEDRRLEFHSPYGCSKGTADQYVLDYARSYGIPCTVFRMSCIYGPHQFGTEDQGWVAHFLIAALENREVTLFGDGKQVRDILFVEDLVAAFRTVVEEMDQARGQAFNIGGGVRNTVSLIELLALIGELHGQGPPIRFDDWRVGDQRYYVSDVGKFRRLTGWAPRVGPREGVERLYDWLRESRAPRVRQLAAVRAAP